MEVVVVVDVQQYSSNTNSSRSSYICRSCLGGFRVGAEKVQPAEMAEVKNLAGSGGCSSGSCMSTSCYF